MRDILAAIAYVDDRADWIFGYTPEPRTHDCARFVGGGVEALTGENPLARFSSQWTSRRGARRVLARHGGMASAVCEVLRPVALTLAQRFDVGLIRNGALVLIEGDTVVGVGEGGRRRVPRSELIQAWSAD